MVNCRQKKSAGGVILWLQGNIALRNVFKSVKGILAGVCRAQEFSHGCIMARVYHSCYNMLWPSMLHELLSNKQGQLPILMESSCCLFNENHAHCLRLNLTAERH